mmetsp:Transcript_35664/g.48157  ORF Transcript_35664/g.48157 Transcript_35664/m.48157 type:complete len:215 (+) Transcript_35664:681-1325(+)
MACRGFAGSKSASTYLSRLGKERLNSRFATLPHPPVEFELMRRWKPLMSRDTGSRSGTTTRLAPAAAQSASVHAWMWSSSPPVVALTTASDAERATAMATMSGTSKFFMRSWQVERCETSSARLNGRASVALSRFVSVALSSFVTSRRRSCRRCDVSLNTRFNKRVGRRCGAVVCGSIKSKMSVVAAASMRQPADLGLDPGGEQRIIDRCAADY